MKTAFQFSNVDRKQRRFRRHLLRRLLQPQQRDPDAHAEVRRQGQASRGPGSQHQEEVLLRQDNRKNRLFDSKISP